MSQDILTSLSIPSIFSGQVSFTSEKTKGKNLIFASLYTPGPLYNTIRYNTVLDLTLIIIGPQLGYFCYFYIFYSHYNTDWIANTEIGLDPDNSVIKRLGVLFKEVLHV